MNLCFDECMPPKWFRRLSDLLDRRKTPIRAFHMLEKVKTGMKDDALLDFLLNEKPRVMVISGDNGRHSKTDEPKLHLLCPGKITSVFISRTLCQVEGFEKVRAIMVCIPAICEAYDGAVGERYRLEATPTGKLYRVRRWGFQEPSTKSPTFSEQLYEQSQTDATSTTSERGLSHPSTRQASPTPRQRGSSSGPAREPGAS